jgi:hypothetical protein
MVFGAYRLRVGRLLRPVVFFFAPVFLLDLVRLRDLVFVAMNSLLPRGG